MDVEDQAVPAQPRYRRYQFSLYDLNRLLLMLVEVAALMGVILGDIWLWARAF